MNSSILKTIGVVILILVGTVAWRLFQDGISADDDKSVGSPQIFHRENESDGSTLHYVNYAIGPKVRYVTSYPVFYATDAKDSVREAAESLAKLLNLDEPQTMRGSPGCAFWVEEDYFGRLSPNQPGFLIRISAGGSVFYFSDSSQARRGMEELSRVKEWDDEGRALIPTGILTNVPIIPFRDW